MLSIDLSSYATRQYVDNAVPTIQASSPLSYSDGTLSIDLSSYATRQYADNSIPSLSGYATQDWALPTSGVAGGQCFYSSKALVGDNGTAWSSSNVSYTYMRIDKAGQPGYLTAA